MNQKPIVFLDMDGVLVDFVGGLQRALGLPYDAAKYPYKHGNYEMFPEAVAATNGRHTMDSLIKECHTIRFWEDLKWERRGSDVLEIVESYSDQVYLTSYPMKDPVAWLGKLRWIERCLPQYMNKVILMTVHKRLLANPNAILLDDRDDNVDQFCAAGGHGWLIPQPWNTQHAICDRDWTVLLESWMKCACKMISN